MRREHGIGPARSLRRAAPAIAAALLAGCSSEPEKPAPQADAAPHASAAAPPSTPSDRKMRMLFATELAMRQVIRDARRDVASIRREFDEKVAALPLPSMLNVTDESLAVFDQADRDARAKAVSGPGGAQEVAETKLKALLDHYENAMWTIANEAGRMESGHELGTRTGYQELDDKVEAAMLQVSRYADLEGVQQLATLRNYDHVGLDREVREELADKGILSLYKSEPVNGLFERGQEGQAVVLVFQRDGLDPKVPLAYVQAVRHIVQRAGIELASTPWALDPATPKKDGIVPIADEVDSAKYFVSREVRPAIDRSAPGYRELFDHVVVSEYRTALRREDTHEFLATIGWQVRWIVDFQGTMRVLVERSDLLLVDDPVLPELLHLPPPKPAPARSNS